MGERIILRAQIHTERGETESIVHQHGGEVFLLVMVDVDEEIDFVFGKHHRGRRASNNDSLHAVRSESFFNS